ncbi:phosphotransferase family protein [Actinomadura rugatobispora]|uniref:Phosphotransferase family protein n=1 Tax=Actinomadura rugatobispora TaxID=1994 RepID=A0ABW1A627_9ACTN|nr:aminoglycoside phosphotransferase family protein [Actinomadura rugatobispora]
MPPDPDRPPPSPELFGRLAEIGAAEAGAGHEPQILYDRHGVLVVRVGDVVVKAHQADRDGGPLLEARMRVADALPELLLPSLGPPREAGGRVVTLWPYGEPVTPEPGALPWEDGARLLAGLHSTPPPEGTPGWGRPERVARLVTRLDGGTAAEQEIRRAFGTLPAWIREEPGAAPPPDAPRGLLHGDWHLGQMVRVQGTWRLIDVEDLGLGDPAWDLARPAALYSAGVLAHDDWSRFLGAYRAFRGPAVPAEGDPWEVLDVPARTLVIQIAATCVQSARKDERPLDGPEQALVDTCTRISSVGSPA